MFDFNRVYDELMASGMKHYDALQKIVDMAAKPEPPSLDKIIEHACKDAWNGGHTQINDLIGAILKEVFPIALKPIEDKLNELEEELKNGQDGRLQKPKGRKSA